MGDGDDYCVMAGRTTNILPSTTRWPQRAVCLDQWTRGGSLQLPATRSTTAPTSTYYFYHYSMYGVTDQDPDGRHRGGEW